MTMLPRRIACAGLALAALSVAAEARAEIFVDFGVASHLVESRVAGADGPIDARSTETGLHLGIGVRRPFGETADIGVRLELDSVDSNSLVALRLFDYRRHPSDRLAYGFFFGAARLDVATPAYGYYLGFGVQLKQITAKLDLGIDLSYGDKLARDNILPSDTQGGSPDNFYDPVGLKVYLSRRF
jgi:hypothetical protein